MKKSFVCGAFALVMMSGAAMADLGSSNAFNWNTYESFRNPAAVINSTLTVDGGAPEAVAFNGSSSLALGSHQVNEVYAAGTGGFANRHIMWLSDNGGSSAYQLQAGESFRISACFTIRTNHPTGVGAPVNSETGIWFHNPRVNDQGVSFIDEGGIWAISNGTSFSGGAAMDFNLYGEGGFNNPNSPPIVFPGDVIEMSYTYFAPGAFAPGAGAQYYAEVNNITRGIFRSSGMKGFGANQLNPGTTIGFRFQNQVFPIQETNTTTNLFNVSVVPAPGAAAMLALGGLVAGRRRR